MTKAEQREASEVLKQVVERIDTARCGRSGVVSGAAGWGDVGARS
jgi:hypothetical protein